MTNYSRSVLKSNGLHRPKIRLKKFSFSLKIVPAYISKKLPSQCWPKPLFIPLFNFSHKRPTFALTPESGYTLAFANKIAHNGSHAETGAFPPSSTAGLCAASEIALSAAFVTLIPQRFYIHTFPGSLWPPLSATVVSQTIFHPVFQLLLQTVHVCLYSRKRVHTRLCSKDRTQRLTRRNTGRFGWGWYHYPRTVPHVHKHPRAGYQNGILCLFWGLVGGAPKERREPRDSDALMRVAVPRRRGPAGLRDLFSVLSKL